MYDYGMQPLQGEAKGGLGSRAMGRPGQGLRSMTIHYNGRALILLSSHFMSPSALGSRAMGRPGQAWAAGPWDLDPLEQPLHQPVSSSQQGHGERPRQA